MKEIEDFLAGWQIDALNLKPAFTEYRDFLASQPDVFLDFKARPGVSYSMRARNSAQKKRDLFVLVDVIDDDPENRWLSVCFYADMVSDTEELGDFVPKGLHDEDAICFNLETDDRAMREYIFDKIKQAAVKSSE